MRLSTTLPFAVVAAGFILPDLTVFRKLGLQSRPDDSPWCDSVPSKDTIISSIEHAYDSLSTGIEDAVHAFEKSFEGEDLDGEDIADFDRPRRRPGKGRKGRHSHDHKDTANFTIYELLTKTNHTTTFAKLVDKYPDIVDLLNSTSANYTLFVPTDKAFERIPGDHKKNASKAFVRYHIGLGSYPARRILVTQTLPTALKEKDLGGESQRLRTSFGLGGLRLNFYSKVIFANVAAKNGFVHAVDHVLVPPADIGFEIGLLPSTFSTLLLALEKTDFASVVDPLSFTGATVFAPTNAAFARLGPAANAFLFNTDKGLGYLRALLKYTVAPNTTLYTDAVYGEQAADPDFEGRRTHTLPTLLEGKSIVVDVAKWKGFVRATVNKHVPIVVRDGVARNGVVQVVGRVPIPPHKHGKDKDDGDEEISVKELVERLGEYVEKDSKGWFNSDL